MTDWSVLDIPEVHNFSQKTRTKMATKAKRIEQTKKSMSERLLRKLLFFPDFGWENLPEFGLSIKNSFHSKI